MCIRDRALLGQTGDVEADNLAVVVGHDAQVRLHDRFLDGREGGCLLYTSDAADERSSVDLGGRRIIKKKNTCRDQRCAMSE